MSLSKRGKNSYRYECQINGQRYCKTVRVYDKKKSEIRKDFERWKMQLESGTITNKRYTFKELGEIWLNDYCEVSCSPIVKKNYIKLLDAWIYPEFGNRYIDVITPLMLNSFINKLKTSTTRYATRENKPLSNGTISKIYEIVRTIFNLAYRNNIIITSPCGKVRLELKKTIKEGKHYWNKEEYQRALFLLQGDKSGKGLAVKTALMTGFRRSELFGLRWEDLEDCKLHVTRTRQKVNGKMIELPCKTLSSERYVSIPITLNKELIRYKQKHPKTIYIFEDIDCDNLTAWFRNWERKQNLPYITFHDLRHTHATLLLQEGVDVKTISKRLGHANITTTLNTYAHVVDELDTAASDVFEKISQI